MPNTPARKRLLRRAYLAHGLDHPGLPQLGDYLARCVFLPWHFAPFRVRQSLTSDLDRFSGGRSPELWAAASDEDKRAILEDVFVRFVIDDKRVVESVLRPPYNWIADAVGSDGVEYIADAADLIQTMEGR